jgi:hypothetical protein
VRENGIVGVKLSQLAPILKWPAQALANLATKGGIRVTTRDRMVGAWLSPDGQALHFYGEAPLDPFNVDRVYRVSVGNGLGASHVDGTLQAAAGELFTHVAKFEDDVFAGTAAARDPEADFWFWTAVMADSEIATRSLEFDLEDVAGGTAELSLRLFAATDTGWETDHVVEARINGQSLGAVELSGSGEREVSFELPADYLAPSNVLEITALLPPHVAYSVLYLDSFSVRHQRLLKLSDGVLEFEAMTTGASVAVVNDSSIQVVDVTDLEAPRLLDLASSRVGLDGWVEFATEPGRRYVVYEASAVTMPEPKPLYRTGLVDRSNAIDYLVIAPYELADAAQELVDYRGSTGYRAELVILDDVYDEFAYGHRDPSAILEMLRFASRAWRDAPQYVVLIGKGTFDYKDHRGLGTNLLPPAMVSTPSGLFASDSQLGDIDGDGVSEIMIGRIPALTDGELRSYVDKIALFESGSGSGRERVLLLSDNSDDAGAFSASSDRISPLLPPDLQSSKIYLDDQGVAQARLDLFSELDRGALLLNYVGHGGLDRMAAEGLLTTADVPGLSGAGGLPIVSSLTCAVGRFEVPGATSLGEALTMAQDRGAVAVWAPSGLSFNEAAGHLDRSFVEALFDPSYRTVGQAIRKANSDYSAEGRLEFMTQIYNLLGDPALQLPERAPTEVLFSDGFEDADLGVWDESKH